MEYVDVPQGSEAWFQARVGLPTASMFSAVLAKGEGKARRSYMMRLAGEIIIGEPAETYTNGHMERGKEMEAEARSLYEFMSGNEVAPCGFFKNHGAGASPDGLIGDHAIAEIKTKLPHLMVETILRLGLPPDHKAQVQGGLWITERERCAFVAYWPKMPLFSYTVYRDEPYIATLAAEVARFREELDEMVARVRKYAA